MSPLQNAEEVLDEGVLANGHNGHTRATKQQLVSDEEKESLNIIASCHHLPNASLSNEKTGSPCAGDAPRHPLAESTTGGTPTRDKSNELIETPPKQLSSLPRNGSSIGHPLPAPTEPIPSQETGPQDQDDGHSFPEGGARAWLVVLGSFSGMTASFGLLNSAGTFQAYLSTHQLAHESPSAVGWIFSLFAFLTFFCGVQIGPVFDAYGPRWLVFAGTVLLFGGMLGVAESTSKCCLLLSALPITPDFG